MSADEFFEFISNIIRWDIFLPVVLAVGLVVFFSAGIVRDILRHHRHEHFVGLRRILDAYLELKIETLEAIAEVQKAESMMDAAESAIDRWQGEYDKLNNEQWRLQMRTNFTGEDFGEELEAYEDQMKAAQTKLHSAIDDDLSIGDASFGAEHFGAKKD